MAIRRLCAHDGDDGPHDEIGKDPIGAPSVGIEPRREGNDLEIGKPFQQCDGKHQHDDEPPKSGLAEGHDDHRKGQIAEPFGRQRPGNEVEGQSVGYPPGIDQQQLPHQFLEGVELGQLHIKPCHRDDEPGNTEDAEGQQMERVEPGQTAQKEGAIITTALQLLGIVNPDQETGNNEKQIKQGGENRGIHSKLPVSFGPKGTEVIEHDHQGCEQAPDSKQRKHGALLCPPVRCLPGFC